MNETSEGDECDRGGRAASFWSDRLNPVSAANLGEARQQAFERLRTLYPKLKPKAINERLVDGTPMGRYPSWLTTDFWNEEIDFVLLAGMQGGKAGRDQAIERIRSVWPAIDARGTKAANGEIGNERTAGVLAGEVLDP